MLTPEPGTEPDFPLPGSIGFLKSTGAARRIVRLNRDGSALVRLLPLPGQHPSRDASAMREDALSDIFADAEDARWAGLPRRRRKVRTAADAPMVPA